MARNEVSRHMKWRAMAVSRHMMWRGRNAADHRGGNVSGDRDMNVARTARAMPIAW
jgi:hypothetical protein